MRSWDPADVRRHLAARCGPAWGAIDAWERGVLRSWLGPRAPAVLLDVGCGDGRLFDLWRQLGLDARGIDGSPEMCARARSRGFEVAPWSVPPLPPGSAEIATCIRLLGHLPAGPADELLRQLCAFARHVVVQVNVEDAREALDIRASGAARLTSAAAFRAVVTAAGATVTAEADYAPGISTMRYYLLERK